ncbi:MAG: tyrosine-type recombinase/integrase, partial [Acidobacteriota bacterium]
FRRALKRAEIEDCNFHDLRHTLASHLVMNGTSIQVVSELLGHSNLKMTQRYAHLAPDYKSRAVGVLDEVFKQKPDLRVIKGGKK